MAEYLVDLNATKAAERAGYSRKTAYAIGQRLLKDVEIAAAIAAAEAERAARVQVRADEVLRELVAIVRTNPNHFTTDDDGRLAGIVSHRDLVFNALVRALGYGTAARSRTLDSILVKEVMTGDVVTTTPDTDITAAAQVMVERKIGCLPVIEEDVLARPESRGVEVTK